MISTGIRTWPRDHVLMPTMESNNDSRPADLAVWHRRKICCDFGVKICCEICCEFNGLLAYLRRLFV